MPAPSLRRLRSAAASLLLAACAAATAPPVLAQADPASPNPDTLAHALLWRVDVPEAPAPSYLFGTIHLIGADDFLLSDSLLQALNRAERVVFEIDPAAMTDMSTAMTLMTKAFMRGDTTLRDLLSAEDYARVDEHFAAKGLPMMFLQRMKPMFLSMLAEMDLGDLGGMLGGGGGGEAEAEEAYQLKSYELELDRVARAAEKEVDGLETVAYQMSLFDSLPYAAQARMLVAAVDNANAGEDGDDPLAALTAIYVSGDVDGMYDVTAGESEDVSGFERTLLTNRNRNWIAPMLTQAAAAPTLFAVGAGHLGGPEGVVRLLRAAGAEVTPLSRR